MHWIDNADSYICPVCGLEVSSPAKYKGCKCPRCGFQDAKDRSKDIMNNKNKYTLNVQFTTNKKIDGYTLYEVLKEAFLSYAQKNEDEVQIFTAYVEEGYR